MSRLTAIAPQIPSRGLQSQSDDGRFGGATIRRYFPDRLIDFDEIEGKFRLLKILFRIVEEYRDELYYVFGVVCLGSWFAFNMWVLRDYFFPCWFPPIYTPSGFLKEELEQRKQEILMKNRFQNALTIPSTLVIIRPPSSAGRLSRSQPNVFTINIEGDDEELLPEPQVFDY
ncbi:unnamed protein product [Bursaphelenchus xylophilus]|uniref:(pine wood nematode) hypothetical protein n=1 Tax=Bursaphelenchus xylophilus TaxID=6326 RepID=A0A1I7S2L0_BURXY|nr:unnamed protein product [Bursaphelenchus xylophilus]CAG9121876.1 unnamed protein product [Bursaphelenchus xylophilus]